MSKPNQNCTLRKKSKNNYKNFTKFIHHKNSEYVVSVRRCAGFLISKDDANSDGGQYDVAEQQQKAPSALSTLQVAEIHQLSSNINKNTSSGRRKSSTKHELKPELDLDEDSESNLMNYNQASDSNRYNRVVDSASSNTNIESESDSDSQSKLQYYNIDIDSKKNINYHKSTTPTSNVNRRTTMDRVKGCARDIKNKFLNLVTTGSDNMIISLFSNLGLSIVFTGIFLGILWALDMLLKSYFGYTIRCCYCSKQSKDLDSAERNSVQNSNSNSTEGPGNESNANVIRNADPNLQDNHNATSSTDDKESDKKSCTSYCSLKPLNDCNHFLRHCDLTGNSNSVTSNLNLKESVSCGSVPDRLPPGCMIDGQTISTLAIRCGVPNFTHRYENYGSTTTNSNHRRRFQLYNNRICVGELVIATTPRQSQTGTLTSNQIQSESRGNGGGIIDRINSAGGMIINPNENNNSFNFNNNSNSSSRTLSSAQSNIDNIVTVASVDGRNQINSNLMILSQPVTDIDNTHMNHNNNFNFQSNSLSDRLQGEIVRASLVEPNSAIVLGQNRMEGAYEGGQTHSSNSDLNFYAANSNHTNRNVLYNLNHSATNYHPHFACTDNATNLRQMQFTNSHAVQPGAYVTFVNSQDPSRSITAFSNSNIVTERTLTQNHNHQLIAGYHGQCENVFQAQSQITDDRVQNQFYRDQQHALGNHNANYNTVPVNSGQQHALGNHNHNANYNTVPVNSGQQHALGNHNANYNIVGVDSGQQRALGNHNANYNTVPVNSDHQNIIGNHNANYNILGVNSGRQQHALGNHNANYNTVPVNRDHQNVLGNHNANHNTVRIINSYNQAATACGDRDKNHIGVRINSDHLKQNACGSRDNNYNGVTVPVNTNSDHQNACGSRDNNYNGVTVPVDTNSDHQNACGSRDNNYNGVPVPVNTNSDHQNACGSRDNNYNGIPVNTNSDHQNASVIRDNNYNDVTVPVDTNSDHQNARGSRDNNYNGVLVPVNTNSDHQNASGSRDNNYNGIPVITNSDHQSAGAIRDNNNYNVTPSPQIKSDHTNVEPQNCDSHGGTGAGAVPWRGVRSRTISAEAEDE